MTFPYKTALRGAKQCPNNCNGVGNCNYDTGLCDCPAGEVHQVMSQEGSTWERLRRDFDPPSHLLFHTAFVPSPSHTFTHVPHLITFRVDWS